MFVVSTIFYVCCSFFCEKKGRVFWPNETRRYRASICISGGKETRGSVRGFPADVVFVFSSGVVFAFVSGQRRYGKGLARIKVDVKMLTFLNMKELDSDD